MANETDIKIGLSTTGADEVVDDLKQVSDATKKIDEAPENAGADDLNTRLEDMKRRSVELQEETANLGNETERTAGKMRLMGAASVGVGIGGAVVRKTFIEIGKALESIDVENLRKLSPVMAEQVEQAKGWAELLTDPLNGIQRLISGTTIGEAFADSNAQLARNIEQHQDHIQRLIGRGKENTAELERLTSRLQFLNDLSAAARAADVASNARSDANVGPDTPKSIAAGTDTKSREAGRIAEEVAYQARSLAAALGPLKERLESAQKAALAAAANVNTVLADPSAGDADIAKARTNAADLAAKTGDLAVELDRQNQLLSEKLREAKETGAAQIEDLARQTGDAVTQAAMDAIAQIESSGAANSPGAGTEAIDGIQKLLTDSTPDAAQGGQLTGLLQVLANNLSGKDAVLSAGITRLIAIGTQQQTQYKALIGRIESLEAAVQQKE